LIGFWRAWVWGQENKGGRFYLGLDKCLGRYLHWQYVFFRYIIRMISSAAHRCLPDWFARCGLSGHNPDNPQMRPNRAAGRSTGGLEEVNKFAFSVRHTEIPRVTALGIFFVVYPTLILNSR
jgi:hypothetical protein